VALHGPGDVIVHGTAPEIPQGCQRFVPVCYRRPRSHGASCRILFGIHSDGRERDGPGFSGRAQSGARRNGLTHPTFSGTGIARMRCDGTHFRLRHLPPSSNARSLSPRRSRWPEQDVSSGWSSCKICTGRACSEAGRVSSLSSMCSRIQAQPRSPG
jgi:hypothetical protein